MSILGWGSERKRGFDKEGWLHELDQGQAMWDSDAVICERGRKGNRLLRRRLGANVKHVKPTRVSSPSSLALPLRLRLSLGLGVRDARNGREWRKGGFLSLVLGGGLRAMISTQRFLTTQNADRIA
jgi:hypothetical protein